MNFNQIIDDTYKEFSVDFGKANRVGVQSNLAAHEYKNDYTYADLTNIVFITNQAFGTDITSIYRGNFIKFEDGVAMNEAAPNIKGILIDDTFFEITGASTNGVANIETIPDSYFEDGGSTGSYYGRKLKSGHKLYLIYNTKNENSFKTNRTEGNKYEASGGVVPQTIVFGNFKNYPSYWVDALKANNTIGLYNYSKTLSGEDISNISLWDGHPAYSFENVLAVKLPFRAFKELTEYSVFNYEKSIKLTLINGSDEIVMGLNVSLDAVNSTAHAWHIRYSDNYLVLNNTDIDENSLLMLEYVINPTYGTFTESMSKTVYLSDKLSYIYTGSCTEYKSSINIANNLLLGDSLIYGTGSITGQGCGQIINRIQTEEIGNGIFDYNNQITKSIISCDDLFDLPTATNSHAPIVIAQMGIVAINRALYMQIIYKTVKGDDGEVGTYSDDRLIKAPRFTKFNTINDKACLSGNWIYKLPFKISRGDKI